MHLKLKCDLRARSFFSLSFCFRVGAKIFTDRPSSINHFETESIERLMLMLLLSGENLKTCPFRCSWNCRFLRMSKLNHC